MKSDVETLNPTRVKLTVAVPYAELKPSVDAAYKALAGQVQVPGFRRGKVPPRVIDQRFGRSVVIQEAVTDALPRFYEQAVTEASVRPLGQPDVAIADLPTGSGADADELVFTAEVDVRPALDLPDYSTIAVTVDPAGVTDADVDEALEKLRVRFGSLVTADRPIESGDVLTLDLKAEVDGEIVDDTQGVSYEVGSGSLLPGLDEALLGRAAGDTVTFTAPLAGGDREGQAAEVTAVVGAVKVRELPAVDDDFAELASEFTTLEELRGNLRDTVGREKTFAQGVAARDKVLAALLEVVDVPVPDAVVEAEVHQHLENESRLDDDAHRTEVDEQTRSVLRQQFLLDAIAEAEEVTVSQEEVIEYLVLQAPRYGMDANTFAQAMGEAGQVPALVGEVARRKALAIVLAQANVTDTDGLTVDLGDGEYDEDEYVDDVDVDASEAVVAGEVTAASDSAPDAAPDPATTASDVSGDPATATDESATDKAATDEPPSGASGASGKAGAGEPNPDAVADGPARPKRTRAPKAVPADDSLPADDSAPAGEPTAEAAPKRRRTTKAAEAAERVGASESS